MQAVNKGKTLGTARHKSAINKDIRRLAGLLVDSSAGDGRGLKRPLGSLFARIRGSE
jgi:hypothetical protein